MKQLHASASNRVLDRVGEESDTTAATSRTPAALWALALGAFGIGLTEFVPIGLLPQLATGFGIDVPAAGWAVTAYATGVLIGAPILTLVGVRVPRRRMLVLLMTVFILGNILTALAPSFPVLIAGRILTSLTHGAFFGIGSVVAAQLVPRERRAAAVAFMFTGLTAANLVGVPLGTWLGTAVDWRAAFVATAVIGVLAAVAVQALVPRLPKPDGVRLRDEVRALGRADVVLAMLTTLLGFGGVFAVVTYLAPLATEVAGVPAAAVAWLLAVLGVGMVTGNWIGGKLADRALLPTVVGALVALVLTLVALLASAQSAPLVFVTVFFVGAFGFATVPPLQTLVLRRASGAPTLASALNIGAFNAGNALAAWLAGATIAGGLGLTSAAWVGAVLTSGGVALALAIMVLDRRTSRRNELAARTV